MAHLHDSPLVKVNRKLKDRGPRKRSRSTAVAFYLPRQEDVPQVWLTGRCFKMQLGNVSVHHIT